MLSVQPLESAKGAADYYAAAFNYYAGDAQALRWLGRGAQILGLSGIVEKDPMLELLQGKLPNGQILQNKKGEHRPGFDMTFSAPKSVSILVGLGIDKELELFHDRAVELTIRQLEEEFAETRIVKDGRVHFEKTNNFVIAAFRQPSSRANDPALHTHAVTMNMTFDKNNKARSLASDIHGNRGVVEQLQQNVTYCGLLYRTNLANMLKGKGYPLAEAGDGLFEIAGMPEPVLKEFSTRREDIEKYMKEQGWSGARAASAATLITRDNKEEHNIAVLRENWATRANALGFDGASFVKDALATQENKGLFESLKEYVFGKFFKKEDLELLKAREAVEVAIEMVSQKSSVFEMLTLKEYALKHTLTSSQVVGFKAVESVIDEKIKNQSLYAGCDPYTQQPMLTTPWLLTLETESLARIETNKGAVLPITTKKNVIDFQSNYESSAKYPLTASQKQAMTQLLTSSDRYMAIQGYAGVGKTTMLKLTREIAESAGFELRGIAVTSSAANELSLKGGIKADVFPVVHGELLRANNKELEKTLFVVDEASMLSSPQGHELIKLIEQKGSRLYLVGDDAQLPSVKNGRIFGLSQEYGIQTAEMVDNIRQLNQSLKESVHHAIDGEVYDAVHKINEVRDFKKHEERIEEVANSYLALSHHVRENTLIFAPTHANRREITVLVREGLKKEGTIGENQAIFTVLKAKALEEAQLYYAQYYSKGDVLRFNHDSKRFGIEKGDYLTVDSLSVADKRNNTLLLINESGKKINFRLNELPKYKSTRAGFNRYIEVYKQEPLDLVEGDRILWTRNFKADGIANSERALVLSLKEDSVTLVLDNGETKILARNHTALKHMDHGYVFTNVKVQGKDKMYGIGLMESYNKFAATLKNFYVQISRGIYSMKLVTDDKNRLIRALEENDDTKKSSIDFVSTSKLIQHQDTFAKSERSINIDTIIDKKGTKEDIFQQRLACIEQYRIFKVEEKCAQSAKLAYAIIADDKFYRLAKATLGFSYQVYREDALRLSLLHLSKSLSQEEKEKLNTVRAYIRASFHTKTAWKQALEINLTPINRAHAFTTALERNALAFKITSNIESYKPYLKHYSIGELNRLGLPQYRYHNEEAKALLKLEQLTEQAGHHQVHTHVQHFFTAQTPSLAFEIKTHSKIAHPYLVKLASEKQQSVDLLWKEINIKAKEHADLTFKLTLTESQQKAFEQIKTYRTLGFELGKLWKENLKQLENNQPLPKEIEDKASKIQVLRNEIAALALQDKAYLPALRYFGLDINKLGLQATKNQQRENVLQFLKSGSDFKNKLIFAELIASDIKGHYPFIKECNVNTGRLNKYARFVTRQQLFSTLSEAEVTDYKKVLSYKYESKNAASAWKKIFALKEQSIKPASYLLNHAFESTAKRDYLASKISNNAQYTSPIAQENIADEKLQSQSKNHYVRTQDINQVNTTRLKLLGRLEYQGPMSTKESKQWHFSWNTLNMQTNKILRSEKLYEQVFKENPLISAHLPPKQKALLEKYELGFHATHKPAEVKSSKSAYQSIDLTITNETLMANSETTYKAIFGVPQKITSKEMRYEGGLIVSLKGSKVGLWFDFGNGAGGGPVQAIMRQQGVNFKEALVIASELAGTKDIGNFIPLKETIKPLLVDEKTEFKNKIKSVVSIMKGTQPIINTLAERYLKEHRNIVNPGQLNVKFWPKNAKWLDLDDRGNLIEKINKIPALVIAARNEKGEVTGVQRIYLDEKTANKNTFMDKAKISKGHIKGSAGVIQEGEKFGTVYVAEGPETGASIAMANPKATVLIAFGLSNIQNLGKVIKSYFPKEVIIAGDNDNNPKSQTFKITNEAKLSLGKEGITASINIPKQINNMEKTDWNDVLKIQGIPEVKKQLFLEEGQHNSMPLTQKEIENTLIMKQELPEKNTHFMDNKLKESCLILKREQDNVSFQINKEIQMKIDGVTKHKPIMVDIKNIESTALKKKEIDLEM